MKYNQDMKQKELKEPSIIGKRIQAAREFRNMEKTALANAINSNYREITRWETTSQEPRALKLKQIADVLQVRMDYFVEPEDTDPDIRFYLSEQEMLEQTGLDELQRQKKASAREYISIIEGDFALKTACHLLMNYADGGKLRSLASVIRELSSYSGNEADSMNSKDDLRLHINSMIDDVDDHDLLVKIANLIIEFTSFENMNKQLEILMQFANNPLK